MPMMTLFDKQIQLRMGQANVKRWVDDIMPLLTDDDPLGVDTFATHRLPLDEAPHAYEIFQKKQDGAVKVVLQALSSSPRPPTPADDTTTRSHHVADQDRPAVGNRAEGTADRAP